MQEAIGNFQTMIYTLIASLLIASVVGYIIVPLILKKFGVDKRTRLAIAKFTVGILFVIAFIIRFKTL